MRHLSVAKRRSGSFASLSPASNHVGSYPNNDQARDPPRRSKRAKSDISRCGKLPTISGQPTDARRGIPYPGEHRQAAKRAAADIEGHSTAAKFSQPERLRPRIDARQTAQIAF